MDSRAFARTWRAGSASSSEPSTWMEPARGRRRRSRASKVTAWRASAMGADKSRYLNCKACLCPGTFMAHGHISDEIGQAGSAPRRSSPDQLSLQLQTIAPIRYQEASQRVCSARNKRVLIAWDVTCRPSSMMGSRTGHEIETVMEDGR
jgi:hypothetical protein